MGIPETRTEFFEYDEEMRKIEWKTKKVTSLEFSKIKQWFESRGYERYARLRLPFALEIQRAIATEFTRVGLPTSPPIYQPVKIELLCEGEEGKPVSVMGASENYAFTTRNKKNVQCHFTIEFGAKLKKELEALLASWKEKQATLDKSDPSYNPLNIKIINLEKFLEDFYMWYGSLSATPLDQKGDPKQLQTLQRKPSPLAISKDKSTEDKSQTSKSIQ